MKIRIVACITAAALLLTGASVWEGAAAIASTGQLPEKGYFAATNSFPKNAVVDITNLENGRTVRVVVASGLETAGLLAILSPEAAGAIGLRGSSIGRIKMSQPADTDAFSRSGESIDTSGQFRPPVPASSPAAQAATAAPADASVVPQASAPPVPEFLRSTVPLYYSEPEWTDDGFRDVAEKPDVYSPPSAIDERIARKTPPALLDPEPMPFTGVSAPVETANVPAAPVVVPYLSPAAENPPPAAGQYRYSLVPSKERTPAAAHSLSPEYFVPPIESGGSTQAAPPVHPPSDTPVSPPAESPADTSSDAFPPFHVPMISGLEQGKYYVQIGAFNRAELVEDEISRIGTNYPLVVQNTGGADSPLFRILLGPLNLGESGALLQRFKSIGYKDAFVRKN
jgi:hypothetical protein